MKSRCLWNNILYNINVSLFQTRRAKVFSNLYRYLCKSQTTSTSAPQSFPTRCKILDFTNFWRALWKEHWIHLQLTGQSLPFHLFPSPDYSLDKHFDHIKQDLLLPNVTIQTAKDLYISEYYIKPFYSAFIQHFQESQGVQLVKRRRD